MSKSVSVRVHDLYLLQWMNKKKDFARQTKVITCANHGNHVQIFMNSRQSITLLKAPI